jgi:DNA helicase II / ATP-dependent DNA helicase PcrA
LCLPIKILRENPDVLAEYHRRFKYILVDEYQDTNTAQYMLLKLLARRSPSSTSPLRGGRTEGAGGGKAETVVDEVTPTPDPSPQGGEGQEVSANHPVNICVVGDDDQSIYGWRGAEIDNILRFEKDFPGALTIKLEQNYRSTAHILGASGHLIAHNEGRLGKTLFTDRTDPDDSKVMIHAGWDSGEEARAVGEEIEQLQRKGHTLNTMAILVRASFQFREFEDRFIEIGLNYRVIGGPRFYERQEVRDALAYFRVCCQPADDLAFERIVNTPKRGLGESAIRQIHDYARARQIPMLQAASELTLTDDMKPKPRHALRSLVEHFERWQSRLDNTPHHELAEQMLDESGYTEMWQNDRSDPKAPERLENLKELIGKMQDYESLRSFLEHVSLVMDAEQNANLDAVNIMTLHSAKGLEFDTVFLPGWEEGLFPHQRALDEGGRSGLEEERRLAYVGLTRAKRRAHIWFVSNRRVHGMWQSTIPSRFLDELPAAHCDVVAAPDQTYGGYAASPSGNPYGASRFDSVGAGDRKGGAQPFDAAYSSPGWQRAQANRTDATSNNWGNRSGHQVERIGYGETDSSFGAGRGSVKNRVMEGELVAKSVTETASAYKTGDRVFHIKFGNGDVTGVEGNKLTILFDRAGEKRVLDGFVRGV